MRESNSRLHQIERSAEPAITHSQAIGLRLRIWSPSGRRRYRGGRAGPNQESYSRHLRPRGRRQDRERFRFRRGDSQTRQCSTTNSSEPPDILVQVNFFLRAYVKIATLRRDLTAQLHDEGFGGDEDDWDDTESLSDAKCRIRMLDSWNSSAKFISVEPLKRFMDEQDDSATGCTCGECGSQTDRLLGEYFEGVTDIWDGEVR